MTGFGKAVEQLPTKKITVEIKSLNSKQFDMTTRIPPAFRENELELRNLVASRLERGKVDMVICVESTGGDVPTRLNLDALTTYKAQIEAAAAALGIPEPNDWYSVLLRFPDAMHSDSSAAADESDIASIKLATAKAVDELMAFRAKEGAKLTEFFTVRIDRIRELLAQIPQWEGERVARIRARIDEGLAKIAGTIDYDKSRLEQEMIFYIEKLDINEEKQRLTQHLNYFMETMALPQPGQGKKLGFISQEMGREINTLGSKSNHAEMQKLVVKMKDELEQIKEQVLNVM